eukprot:1453797-Pyramimonas_sp.AAC.1
MQSTFDMYLSSNNNFIKHVDHYISGAAQAGFSMHTTAQPLPILPPPPPQTSSLNTNVLSVGGVPEEEIEFFMNFNPSAASLTPPVASASTSAAASSPQTPTPLTPPVASASTSAATPASLTPPVASASTSTATPAPPTPPVASASTSAAASSPQTLPAASSPSINNNQVDTAAIRECL